MSTDTDRLLRGVEGLVARLHQQANDICYVIMRPWWWRFNIHWLANDHHPFTKTAIVERVQDEKERAVKLLIDIHKALSWTSVAPDSMPAAGEQVWVSYGDDGQGYAIWTGDDWFIDTTQSGDLYSRRQVIRDGFDARTPTHWMPMPSPPSKPLKREKAALTS